MSPRIFISYRRADSKHVTSRIRERLTDAFGKDAVFHDVEKIPPGSDFRGALRDATSTCRVMLVVIGRGWVSATDASGNRRLDNPADFVRIEIETGLQRGGVTVIPLLVDGAEMPFENQLTDALKSLVFQQSFTLHDDPIFDHDAETLIHHLRSFSPDHRKVLHYTAVVAMLILLITAMAIIMPPLLTNVTITPSLTISSTPDHYVTALANAQAFRGTRNTDWEPFVYTFPDDPAQAPMALVPVGTFRMGRNGGNPVELPVHPQTITEPFWMDQTEVTRAQYRLCVSMEVCSEAPENPYSTRDTQPINRVTWFQARDYCHWRGENYHLPTEREWEYSARGVESWTYPWGESQDFNTRAVYWENSEDGTSDVGSKPEGMSWVGAFDLAGNVWEWVNTIYGVDLNSDTDFVDPGERLYEYPYFADDGREANSDMISDYRVLRGGSWYENQIWDGAAIRDGLDPTQEFDIRGFRCARDS